ncbi:hypothetical protein [Paraburkholderia phenazinium]|jgi:hypothetical protein|uniref:hypothetical protein n=1 Tax=Paraburkholderia phenazinium TaxID=60549 RepID=UPI00094113F1|nr:hypothetical protein [Paraburkholderia phenazinium]
MYSASFMFISSLNWDQYGLENLGRAGLHDDNLSQASDRCDSRRYRIMHHKLRSPSHMMRNVRWFGQ